MSNKTKLWLLLFSVATAFFSFSIEPKTASAQSAVHFSETEVINHFPDELIFQSKVLSSAGNIISAKFIFTSENYYSTESFTKESLAILPGPEVSLEYILDTRDFTTPPMMTYTFHWEVETEHGVQYQSEPVTIRYEDTRFNWQVLENADIGVWWHDRPDSFGESIFEIAASAVEYQRVLFQTDLDYQMRIVISNSSEEFAAWHNISHDWVGGQTFSNYGVTVQIVGSESYQDIWLNGVIPHEISHLYFDQVTYNPTVSIPVWLNEGVAQYNEFVTHEWEATQVKSAAKDGRLIPLSSLANGFGAYDEERIYLAYHESLSAVTYLVDTYGSGGLSKLLLAYKEGISTDKAFQTTFGISIEQFELDWATSVGATVYAIPTARPLPTFFPSPTPGIMNNPATPTPLSSPGSMPSYINYISVILFLGLSTGAVWYFKAKK